jgi:hypothetical protein
MNDAALNVITSNCTRLTSITLKGPYLVTDGCFKHFFESRSDTLTHISLENAAKVGTEALNAMASIGSSLKSLTLSECRNLGDEGVNKISILTRLESLELLELGDDVSDSTLISVLSSVGPHLTKLSLVGYVNTLIFPVYITIISKSCLILGSKICQMMF